jgi:hypothetical protein
MTRRRLSSLVILGVLVTGVPAFAQQPQTKMRSTGAAIAGLVMMGAGMGLVSAPGETYTILGDDFCVTTYEVKSGSCWRSPQMRTIGFALMGAGAVTSILGFQRVTVSPTYKGAKATYTLTW